MKKRGFTLAEVLVTLTIIGIVATMTIPSLIMSVTNAQFQSSWKKAFSSVSAAIIRAKFENPGTTAISNTDLGNYMTVTKTCASAVSDGCWASDWKCLNGSTTFRVNGTPQVIETGQGLVLANGMLINIVAGTSVNLNMGMNNISVMCGADSVTRGFLMTASGSLVTTYIFIDVNGFKGPNTLGKDINLAVLDKITSLSDLTAPSTTCDASGIGCGGANLIQ